MDQKEFEKMKLETIKEIEQTLKESNEFEQALSRSTLGLDEIAKLDEYKWELKAKLGDKKNNWLKRFIILNKITKIENKIEKAQVKLEPDLKKAHLR